MQVILNLRLVFLLLVDCVRDQLELATDLADEQGQRPLILLHDAIEGAKDLFHQDFHGWESPKAPGKLSKIVA